MERFQEEFLEGILKEGLPSACEKDQLIFKMRFNPKFHDKKGEEPLDNNQIYLKVQKILGELEKLPSGTDLKKIVNPLTDTKVKNELSKTPSLTPTDMKEIVNSLTDTFEKQMREDGVDVEFLRSKEPGTHGKWKRVYDWLWDKHYPRWYAENASSLLDQQWQKLVNKAHKNDDWLKVTDLKRNVLIPELTPATIPLKEDIYLVVEWNGVSCYLLLLNQGTSGKKLCFCPSKGFALSGELSQQTMYLPQIGAAASSIKFLEAGKEHFLGIVMEKPLDLDWLPPTGGESLPLLDAIRLKELWEKLELQGNWQMFYKSFEVV